LVGVRCFTSILPNGSAATAIPFAISTIRHIYGYLSLSRSNRRFDDCELLGLAYEDSQLCSMARLRAESARPISPAPPLRRSVTLVSSWYVPCLITPYDGHWRRWVNRRVPQEAMWQQLW
jgi:hypothetical protein